MQTRVIPSTLRALRGAEDGATLTEFAIVAPVFVLMLMGVFDIAHTQYTTGLMNGAMQRAGRDLTLENAGSRQDAIDAQVIERVRAVVPLHADVTLEKLSHFDFSDIGEPEEIIDDDGDQVCEPGERYIDSNGNGQWDDNRGEEGIGGARDAVLYTVNVTYGRLFPLYSLGGEDQQVTLEASTVLRNQPFDEQDETVETGDCA